MAGGLAPTAQFSVESPKGLSYVVRVYRRPRPDSTPNDVSIALNQSVVYADPRNDLTQEVIGELNRRFRR
jgi:hypothetical protein